MRTPVFIERSPKVQVLAAIALVLFCVTFLRFVTLAFAEDAPRPAPLIETSEAEVVLFLNQEQLKERNEGAVLPMRTFRCGTSLMRMRQLHQHEAAVQHELKLRAAQRPEVDDALQHRLRLDVETAQSPIMR